MKQKNNFASWWRYISGRKCYFYTLTTKMAPLNFCSIQTTLHFLLYHMQNKLFGYLQYPRSVALQKFCGGLFPIPCMQKQFTCMFCKFLADTQKSKKTFLNSFAKWRWMSLRVRQFWRESSIPKIWSRCG